MADLRSEISKLSDKLQLHVSNARALAARLEQGQAQRPLSARVEALAEIAADARVPVTLALIGGAPLEPAAQAVEAFLAPSRSRLIVASDPAGVCADPAALGEALRPGGLLVVAGPGDREVGAAELALARLLARHSALTLPIVLAEGLPEGKGWWLDSGLCGSAGRLSPATSGATATRATPELSGALQLLCASRELAALSRLLGDLHRIARAQAHARLAAAQRRMVSIEESARRTREARSELDPIRDAFHARIAALGAEVQEANRKALLPGGSLRARIASGVAAVGRADLCFEPAASAIRVTLHEGLASRVEREARGRMREALREDLLRIRDGLAEIERDTAAALARAAGEPGQLVLPPPDGRELQNALDAQVEVESRFRSELPKRGFLQRVMEGRRAAFMVLILLSLFGGSFSLRRMAFFPVMMGVLFVAGTAWTYVSWKRQEDDRIGKELDRLREGLEMELRKMHGEIQREKLGRLSVHLSDVQKTAGREIERLARQLAQQRLDQVESQRGELRSRLRSLEARVRSRATEGSEVDGLASEAARAQLEAMQLAKAALSASHGART